MSAPLLIQDPGAECLRLARRGRLNRLVALLQATRIDGALAAGANPDSRVELLLRAERLLHRSTRRRLASELHTVLRRAEQPRRIFDPTVPLARSAILANREAIQELAEWLEDLTPMDVRGVAQLRLLLRDGTSPLYPPSDDEGLEETLQRAYQALIPSPGIWTST